MSISIETPSRPTSSDIVLPLIEKVIRAKGATTKAPDEFYIHVSGHILVIDTDKMTSPSAFVKQFFKHFNKILPFEKGEWLRIAEHIADLAEDGGYVEDSDLIVTDLLYEKIVNDGEVTDDKNDLDPLDGGLYLWDDGREIIVLSSVVRELLKEDFSNQVNIGKASDILNRKGKKIKKSDNDNVVWINGGSRRCWFFDRDEFMKARGEEDEQ
ncbi:MAG: hypothetical protein AWU58_326 [Methanohalophilus sp. T328-1]|uniref:hypothetical protein n=1 Tax=Methanohalophilus sp. DAL1 TaxID=1864608 RepID=UPI00079BA151|nr:hypothetical protein [Methanohalophilus sp. DAL1]KXS46722.1 MAG: hypothetical protein AWU58_326 [Methanohalophilus sp. T328-1]OBZ35688.1 MAG: hypothetical protein A9957_06520 [Methanohalophilus sp. DAL1]